ncbi:aspartyl protease family protein [Owenweeksia hongkongensis]|uniref:aspartyl protease family protein n=1 Tax=Owenweeksia hongkongensis TaxID=253245 RepID=UPI003A92DCA6
MKNQFNQTKTFKKYFPMILGLYFGGLLFTSCGVQSEIYWTEGSSVDTSISPLQIPLYKLNKLILIKGEVRGESGYFIFDTGAPGLVLNEAHFEDYQLDPTRKVTGVNGQLHDAHILYVRNLKLGKVAFKQQTADVIDLSHIEKKRNVKILGLLGVDLFRGVELEIDLHKHILKIYKTDKEGNRLYANTPKYKSNLISMPFKYSGAFIELQAEINNKSYRIAFDTGSETLLLDKNLVVRDKIYTSLISSQPLLSTDGSKSGIEIRQLENIKIGLNLKKVTTLTTDFNKLRSHGINVDGLIGYDLMASGIVTINFKNRILQIQPYAKA